ncbi:MAG: hypothetical protein MUE51_15955, partial [Thermoleophilia bacterium]|nr:hypothetical protein [Thermoleophilia bacterium]
MSRIPRRRPLVAATALAALACAPVVAVLAAPPDSTTLISRTPGFGPLAAPAVNDSATGDVDLQGQARRVVSDTQNNRYVAFTSQADGLSAEDDDRFENVFVRDRQTGRTILVSRANGPDSVSGQESHVFVRDIVNNTTELIDRANGSNGAVANEGSSSPSVTTDAGLQPVVAFMSSATNLGATTGGFLQVYVRRVTNDTTTLVSAADNSASAHGTGSSTEPAISANGNRVAFTSAATNLTGVVDDNASNDVFVRALSTNDTLFVTQASAIGDADSFAPSINQDGTKIAFASEA